MERTGLRSVVREDLGSTACEMVYGMNLHLPSQFFDFQSMPFSDFSMYREQQKAYLHNFNYILPRIPTSRSTYIDKKLDTCSHVFIKNDAHTGPLDQPWTGPYAVLEGGKKTFVVMRNDRHYTVSVDRIKAAFLLEDYLTSRVNLNCLPITSASPDLHRLGKRNVHRPAYLNDYYC